MFVLKHLNLKGVFMKTTKKLLNFFIGVAMLSLLATAGAVFAQAATVLELTGTATAANITPAAAPGAPAATPPISRALRKGDTVNQGETIRTGAVSSIVLRFSDGQIAAMASNSSMAINNYVYNQAEPAKSNVFLSLLNGGMRAVTGLIGKARPQAVAYRAGNATIGIRGTDVTFATADGDVVVSVTNGEISFTFAGSTVSIPAGQAALTANGKVTQGTIAAINAAVAANPNLANALKSVANDALQNAVADAAAKAAAEAKAAADAKAAAGANGTPGANSGNPGSGGGTVICTSVSPTRVPDGCTPPKT